MQEMIIVSGRKYFYTDGKVRKQITAKEGEKMFQGWKAEGKNIKRRYTMGGKVVQCWYE